MAKKRRIILALDVSSNSRALRLAELLRDEIAFVKVGLQAFTACGPSLVGDLVSIGVKVFLDLKLHDIPNTAAQAAGEAVRLGCSMMTLHIFGGLKMLSTVRLHVDEIAKEIGQVSPRLLGVTILTSLDKKDLTRVGVSGNVETSVRKLAHLALEAGLDGVVTSPRELGYLGEAPLDQLLRVTPGVRPRNSSSDDQSRVMTPIEAIQAGANYLVIGRPIISHNDPLKAARRINQDLESF